MKLTVVLTLFLVYGVVVPVAAQEEVQVNIADHQFKPFGRITDQQVDLSRYKSPNLRPGQDANRTIVMSASGGGLRAAAFTIGVMLELERIGYKGQNSREASNLLNEIDYFSTTSGGGWGVGTYVAYKYMTVHNIDSIKTYNSFEKQLANWVDRTYSKYQGWYALRGLVNPYGANLKSSVTMTNRLNYGYLGYGYFVKQAEDRYRAIHNTTAGFIADSVNVITLGDVFTLKAEPGIPLLPMMICNTTNISSFMLVPFSPDRLQHWGIRQYHTTAGYEGLIPAQPRDILTERQLLDVPLALGLKSSSSVPLMIGATPFSAQRGTEPYYLFLEDGGIMDNLGLHNAKTILRQPDQPDKLLLVVDASKNGFNVVLPQKPNARRLKTAARVALNGTPDAQYALTRENLQTYPAEFDCRLVYLGTEVLLDTTKGRQPVTVPAPFTLSKKDAESRLYTIDSLARANPRYFLEESPYEDRVLLYQYIHTYLKTWFNAKWTRNKGKYVNDINETTGNGKIMTLAGRAVVQLALPEIRASLDGTGKN